MSKRQKKSQSSGQKRKLKAQKRNQRKSKAAATSSAVPGGQKHLQQLKSLTPVAWADENRFDVAVFDETIFATLDSEEQQTINAVRESFASLEQGRNEEAALGLADIPRKSPMSEWRMLVRGMQHWFSDDVDAAVKAWSRLDPTRRPARIACALELALHDDLTTVNMVPTSAVLSDGALVSSVPIDSALLLGAKVVKRTRISRPAINLALKGIDKVAAFDAAIEESVRQAGFADDEPELTISPELIAWLKDFGTTFRSTEPKLVRALELAALERASQQCYEDIFEMAVKQFKGPPHDPGNNLRCYFYGMDSGGKPSRISKRYLTKYLEIDLPSNKAISQPLRNALVSSIHLQDAEAEVLMAGPQQGLSIEAFAALVGADSQAVKDLDTIEKIRADFTRSIAAYPANHDAHVKYTDWLEEQIEQARTNRSENRKKEVGQLQDELSAAMKFWVESIATDVRPREFLAEALLDDEQLEEATPHIEWLVSSRPGDPKVKALPWKLKLLEAMKACRRVSSLPRVPGLLAEVKKQWPDWLATRWLPYFTAAWMLRCGEQADYKKQRESICADNGVPMNSLVDACMMLGAAQKMKVAAADLKPLRVPVEEAVKECGSLSDEELIAAGSFFWSMHKARIVYPAYRMHGAKFGRELLRRMNANPDIASDNSQDPEFHECVFWLSERRFWGTRYESKIPVSLYRLVGKNSAVTAAHLNGLSRNYYVSFNKRLRDAVASLKQSVRTEPDPYYRHWFAELIDGIEAREREADKFRDFESRFGELINNYARDLDSEDCLCSGCVAQRERDKKQEQQLAAQIEQFGERQFDLF